MNPSPMTVALGVITAFVAATGAAHASAHAARPTTGGKPMIPMAGGFTKAPTNDPDVRAAVAAAVAELSGPAWLGRKDLAAGPIRAAERQVVAGTNHRVAFQLTMGGASRPARVQVWHDLKGARHLTAVDLGEPGADGVDAEPPASTPGLPGGWSDQAIGDASTAARVKRALGLLAGAGWLGRTPEAPRVVAARTQVVAGYNSYLAFEARLGGKGRHLALVMYESPQDEASLSWVRLEAR